MTPFSPFPSLFPLVASPRARTAVRLPRLALRRMRSQGGRSSAAGSRSSGRCSASQGAAAAARASETRGRTSRAATASPACRECIVTEAAHRLHHAPSTNQQQPTANPPATHAYQLIYQPYRSPPQQPTQVTHHPHQLYQLNRLSPALRHEFHHPINHPLNHSRYEVLGKLELDTKQVNFVVCHDLFDTCEATRALFKPLCDKHSGCQVGKKRAPAFAVAFLSRCFLAWGCSFCPGVAAGPVELGSLLQFPWLRGGLVDSATSLCACPPPRSLCAPGAGV